MKRSLLLLILLFLFGKANAQKQWMFLTTDKSTPFWVDTLTRDTKVLNSYDSHFHVFTVWAKFNKGGETHMMRIGVDTIKRQIEYISEDIYRNGKMANSKVNTYTEWNNVAPKSLGEALVSYCRAWHHPQLMRKFIANSSPHAKSTGKKKRSG
ncbi:MAG TPA: hypothetical protein VG367_17635 [Mucilaginibacter sp.]|jgi:hypothetical protein|nr:hypothetical protein [Mucilaginibacter sp.]